MRAAVEHGCYWAPRVRAWLEAARSVGQGMWPVFREELCSLLSAGAFEQRQALLLLALHGLQRRAGCPVTRKFLVLERLALRLNPRAVEVFGKVLLRSMEREVVR